MTQATWHSTTKTGLRFDHGLLRGFRPPSDESAFIIAFSAVVVAVVFLHMRGAVAPRPEVATPIIFEAPVAAPANLPAAISLRDAPIAAPPSAVAPPAPALPIRDVDLPALPALQNLTSQTGASIDTQLITYGALTGAGDVALVPLQSGGSAGTVATAVVAQGADGPRVLTLLAPDKASWSRLRADLEAGELVTTTAVLGPEDALCCPSETRRAYYTWDGSKLVVQREEISSSRSAKD